MKQEDFEHAQSLLADIETHDGLIDEINLYGSQEWQENIENRYAKERNALRNEDATFSELRHAGIMLNIRLLQAEKFIARWLTPEMTEKLREGIEIKKQWLQEAFDKL